MYILFSALFSGVSIRFFRRVGRAVGQDFSGGAVVVSWWLMAESNEAQALNFKPSHARLR